jgi:hypothetical protein
VKQALTRFKQILTLCGAKLAPGALLHLQATLNYVKIGRWMRDHNFNFNRRCNGREEVWEAVVGKIRKCQVLYLEFGVGYGESMSYWSGQLKHSKSSLHGFDSFVGLPEAGGPWRKGQFDVSGCIPDIRDPRVKFFKGWFDQVLPEYSLPEHEVLVINMDADLYSSTIFVLRHLRPFIKPGTFIYFDEMNHVDHEPRAFDEFLAETGLRFRPVSADRTLAFVFFECDGPTAHEMQVPLPGVANQAADTRHDSRTSPPRGEADLTPRS